MKKVIIISLLILCIWCIYLYILFSLDGPISPVPEPSTDAIQVTELAHFGKGKINDMAVSPDGEYLAIASKSGVWIYHFTSSDLRKINEFDSFRICWSPIGQKLAITTKQEIRIWDPVNVNELGIIDPVSGEDWDPSWSPNGELIAAINSGGIIKTWDANSYNQVSVYDPVDSNIDEITWSFDSRKIYAMSDEDGTIKSWDIRTGVQYSEYDGENKSADSFHISPGGSKLVYENSRDIIILWDKENPDHKTVIGSLDGGAYWSPDGNGLVLIEKDEIKFYSLEKEVITTKIPLSLPSSQWFKHFCWYPDGNKVVVYVSDGSVQLWDLKTGEKQIIIIGFTSCFFDLSWSSDGERLAIGGQDGKLRIWDTHIWQEELVLDQDGIGVELVAWSPDNSKLAISLDRWGIKIYNTKNWEVIHTIIIDDYLYSIAWSPDGNQIAAGGFTKYLYVWNANTGKVEWKLDTSTSWVNRVAWSPDGKRLASTSSIGKLVIWDTSTWKPIRKYSRIGSRVSWSPTSDIIIIADSAGNIRILNIYNWQFILSANLYPAHKWGMIDEMNWSPNSTYIAITSTGDSYARIWGVDAGKVLADVEGIDDITWSPDETMFAAIEDGIIRVYEITD